MKSDLPYLAHIADSITAIQAYVAGGREAFMRERLIQDAVIRNFEIIGEAAGRLSTPTGGLSDTPWKKVVAFGIALFMATGVWTSCSSGTSSKTSCLR